jgi:hypothetical protein
VGLDKKINSLGIGSEKANLYLERLKEKNREPFKDKSVG